MSDNPLKIIASSPLPAGKQAEKSSRRLQAKGKYDRQWLMHPEQFDVFRNCKERERIQRTFQLILDATSLKDRFAVDLGCAGGSLSKLLNENGAHVHAVDISSLALSKVESLHMAQIQTFLDYVPRTSLQDEYYDLVLCADLIASLHQDEHRLLMSELCRLMKQNAFVVCSTSIDINSIDALERFKELAETEFEIEKWIFSHHRLWIRLSDFFNAPKRFVKAWQSEEYKQEQMAVRRRLSLSWFEWNSRAPFVYPWVFLQYFSNPIAHFITQNRSLLLLLEKISRFFYDEAGISHAIFLGRRRALTRLPPAEIPVERKSKRHVWE